MNIIDGVRVLTYEEWLLLPNVLELIGTVEDDECPVCDGSGNHECECGNTHDCENCDGRGTERDVRDIYTFELKSELEKLLAWREGLPIDARKKNI